MGHVLGRSSLNRSRAASETDMLLRMPGAASDRGAAGVALERAAEFGTVADRDRWRLVGPMHIADTKEQAIKDVEFGLAQWVDYFRRVAALPLAPDATENEDLVDALHGSGFAGIGPAGREGWDVAAVPKGGFRASG